MGVVGRGEVDNVDVRVGEHLVKVAVHLAHAVFFPEGSRLLMGAVAHRVQPAPHGFQRRGHLVGDNAGAQNGPAQGSILLHCKNLPFPV